MLSMCCAANIIASCVVMAATSCGESKQESSASSAPLDDTRSSPSTSLPEEAVPNAAARYSRILQDMGKGFLDPLQELSTTTPPGPVESEFLRSKQPIIKEIIEASTIERCVFNEGDDRTTTLAWARTFGRLLQFDAHRLLRSPGGQAGAAERLASLVRIALHAGYEPVMVNKLVMFALLNLGVNSAKSWRDRLTDAEHREKILVQLRAAQIQLQADMRPIVRGEVNLVRDAILKGEAIVGLELEDIPIQERGIVTTELERSFALFESAWNAPTAAAELHRIEDGARNATAKRLLSVFRQFHKQLDECKRNVASAIDALEK